MYLHQEILTTTHIPASTTTEPMLYDGNVEAAVVRGRKIQSDALWNLSRAIGRPFVRAFVAFRRYRETAAALRELRAMDHRMLSDIGLSRDDVAYAVRHGGFVKPSVTKIDVSAMAPVTDVANDTAPAGEREAA